MAQILIRFLVGGLVVSLFALLGDLLRPKSFAGLFGAAPSVALGTLTLTLLEKSHDYAAIECRSMLLGSAALLVYCVAVSALLTRARESALKASLVALPVWFAVGFVLLGIVTVGH